MFAELFALSAREQGFSFYHQLLFRGGFQHAAWRGGICSFNISRKTQLRWGQIRVNGAGLREICPQMLACTY